MITVATFNARHGRPPTGLANNRLLAASVAGLHADVVALQEVDRHVIRSWFRNQPAAIARAAGMHWEYAPARRLDLIGDDGIALLVRGEIVHARSTLLPRADRSQARTSIIARVRIAGTELTVATTHLHGGAHAFAERQLDALLEMVDAEAEPHVLLGDLNLETDRVRRHVGKRLALAAGEPTFPADHPTRRIDHVAVRGLDFASASVRRLAVSDHRALVAVLH
jgi:endonuclease/exonuclease/phosphatase family metal-dependent hydrolase